jgi:hypothetical protein
MTRTLESSAALCNARRWRKKKAKWRSATGKMQGQGGERVSGRKRDYLIGRKTFVYHICLSRVGIQNYIYRHVQRSNDKLSVAQFDIPDALEREEKQKEVWSSVMSECVRG